MFGLLVFWIGVFIFVGVLALIQWITKLRERNLEERAYVKTTASSQPTGKITFKDESLIQPIATKFIYEDEAVKPYKKFNYDAGWDLRANEDVVIPPLSHVMIGTGTKMIIPKGYYGQIQGRSGLAAKYGIITLGGVIDSTYRGEVKVILFNGGREPVEIKKGYRIAQVIILPVFLKARFEHESQVQLDKHATERNASGFGSTGIN